MEYNGKEISTFVGDRLKLDFRVSCITSDLEQSHGLRTDLVRRAYSVCRWVHLVIPMVKIPINDAESPENVQQWLQQIPERQ